MFQCTTSVLINGGTLVLPAGAVSIEATQAGGAPGIGPCVVLSMSELQLHLRLHDFFFGKYFLYLVKSVRADGIRQTCLTILLRYMVI